MAQRGHLFPIRSISTVHFTGAATQNQGLAEDIPIPPDVGFSGKGRIVSMALWSVQNLDWDIFFFTNGLLGGQGGLLPAITAPYDFSKAAVGPPYVAGTEGTGITFAGRFKLAATAGFQINAQGPFFYYNDGNDIPYFDETAQVSFSSNKGGALLHTVIVNRNASAKIAGTGGALTLVVNIEPTSA